jgi:hypothetical protein
MNIHIKKFGTVLISRPTGKEAWLAFQPVLNENDISGEIVVDFEGVAVLAPSWADEFLTPLIAKYKDQVVLKNIQNPSVEATLKILSII